MRLLYVHDRFGAMAGAEVNVLVTAAEFKKRGHVVGLLHGNPTGIGEAEWREVFSERFGLGAAGSAAAQRGLDIFRPDAVYVHKMSDLAVLEALVRCGCPLVRMVHDHELYCLRAYKYFPLSRNICKRAMGPFCVFPCGGTLGVRRNSLLPLRWQSYRARKREMQLSRRFHRILVASRYMQNELLRNGFNLARIEIHAPVPPFNDAATQSSFSNRNRIIYAGQVIRGKGVDVMLESLARVRAAFECVVLGEGNFRPHCERLAEKLGLNGRVGFKGYVPRDALHEFYAEASLSVVSSVWPEPFGAVGLEAMRYGLPVVAFDSGGIREWLLSGQNGFLVPWMDRAQLAARIEELLLDKPLARRMGDWGRQFARDKFHFGRYISGLEEMFAKVILEPQRRSR
jgi:glycosyltransferase involved in cell wall biosynthesis